jgi:DNA-binding NarL/FixJ family response regulator
LATTRILLDDMPQIFQDLVTEIMSDYPEIVVERLGSDESPDPAASRSGDSSDCVVVTSLRGSQLSPKCDELLKARRSVRVLALSAHSDTAYLYELVPHRLALGALSPETIVRAIRSEPTE